MSLINDALKKAQNQRTSNLADAAPMPGGSGADRGQRGMPTGVLVLLVAGAVVVVIISVVATVYFVNRAPSPKAAPAPFATSSQPVAAPSNASAGPISPAGSSSPSAPAVSPGAASSSPSSAAVSVPTLSAPSPVIIAPVIVKATPPPVEPPPAPPSVVEEPAATAAATPPAAEPVVEGSLEDRINAYVDKVRVTGIRTSEAGSKVLMNDHVYRVNDLVDRKLGLKLVKIAPDNLTFADAKGATYVKSF